MAASIDKGDAHSTQASCGTVVYSAAEHQRDTQECWAEGIDFGRNDVIEHFLTNPEEFLRLVEVHSEVSRAEVLAAAQAVANLPAEPEQEAGLGPY
jgi:hypothetical protein